MRGLVGFMVLVVGCRGGEGGGQSGYGGRLCWQGMWVWRVPEGGVGVERLVVSAVQSGVSLLLVDVYEEGGMVSWSRLRVLDRRSLDAGVGLLAVWGSPQWLQSGVGCDSDLVRLMGLLSGYLEVYLDSGTAFRGVVLDVEPGEPVSVDTFEALLDLVSCVREWCVARGLWLGVAFRAFWRDTVVFGGVAKPVFQHLIDLADIPIVMAYRDFAGGLCPDNGIVCLSWASVAYAMRVGKPLLIGLETGDCAPACGPEYVTFYEEGQWVLNYEVGRVLAYFSGMDVVIPIGFVLHAYGDSYLRGEGGWPRVNPGFPCWGGWQGG